jgi:glycosyltransferase involved in cell wall biosynthesis
MQIDATSRSTATIMIMANSVWYLVNFRLSLIRLLIKNGLDVVAVAPQGEDATLLTEAGIRFIPFRIDSKGTNPLHDTALFLRIIRLIRRERPAVFLGYTVKPNIYGGLACRLLGTPAIHNITGLGTAFIRDGWLTRIVKRMYQQAFEKATIVYFQNRDDRKLFVESKLVTAKQAKLLPGSGVDLKFYSYSTLPRHEDASPFRFILIARLLWDKGIGEYVAAARQLKAEEQSVQCDLLGFLGAENSSAIPSEMIEAWEQEGVISYLGSAKDVRPYIASADCVVLPSYREGTPRSLLEAASMGRPIITTDTVGCRETVEDGETGFLCKPFDSEDLVRAMQRMMNLKQQDRSEMGQRARSKMETQFDEQIVLNSYISSIEVILSGQKN